MLSPLGGPTAVGLGSVSPVTRVWWRDRSVGFDVAVMLACVAVEAVFTVIALRDQAPGTTLVPATVLIWSGQLAADAALLVRRRWPVPVLGLSMLAAVPVLASAAGLLTAAAPVHSQPWMPVSIPIAVYSATVYARNRAVTWTLLGLVAVLVAQPWRLSWFTVATSACFVAVPVLLGLYVAARRRLIAALTDRAERAEREQVLLARQARAEERLRLASEMHDVVTHRVSLMVLQAGALRMTTDREPVRVAAEELRATGGQALTELRELIGVLRTNPDAEPVTATAVAPVPELAELIAESRAVGGAVELVETGTAYPVAAAVGRAAFRVVQEALTNARKHAPGAPVTVRVTYGDSLEVTVANGAPTAEPDPALSVTGSKTGLAGLRHRVELLGGNLTTGANDDDGFTVAASLPRPTGGAR